MEPVEKTGDPTHGLDEVVMQQIPAGPSRDHLLHLIAMMRTNHRAFLASGPDWNVCRLRYNAAAGEFVGEYRAAKTSKRGTDQGDPRLDFVSDWYSAQEDS